MGDGREGIPVEHSQPIEDASDPLFGIPYRATRLLGEGGTAHVYEARPLGGGRPVAVKLLKPHLIASDDAVERMRIEAEALHCLHHPNIVCVLDFGRTPSGCPYIVEERLYGRSLHKEILARGPLPVLEATDYVCQLLAGLEVVHRLGVVHRDLKLANLFLVRDKTSGTRLLKLVDFGFAKVLRIESSRWRPKPMPVSTNGDIFVGTPRFAAPEQVASGYELGPVADLYTAGLVLYSLLAGREPYHQIARQTDVLMAQIQQELSSPGRHASEPIADELEQFLRKATEKNPADRFPSASVMRSELELLRNRMSSRAEWAAAPRVRDARLRRLGRQDPEPANGDDLATVQLDAQAFAQLAMGEVATKPGGRSETFLAALALSSAGSKDRQGAMPPVAADEAAPGEPGGKTPPSAGMPPLPSAREDERLHRLEAPVVEMVTQSCSSAALPIPDAAQTAKGPTGALADLGSGSDALGHAAFRTPVAAAPFTADRSRNWWFSPPIVIGLGILLALLTIVTIVWRGAVVR